MKPCWCLLMAMLLAAAPAEADLPREVAAIEQRRIEVVRKITPATIAIFDASGQGGGSGVLISTDGYALTNFHVVAPCGPFMQCGLPDGTLVDAVLIGLDPTGDIALIRLLDEREYPVAEMGDSDLAAIGDEVFAVGNPFLLADDLQPTVTHGVLSGTRRYQYPANAVLEYADCLQTDAAINPGNSGGPLYDGDGRLIGINGRISVEKRGRVNVGIGYAVSINQVKWFIDQLKTGRTVDHGALGATARTTNDRRVLIDAVDESSDAYRRGLRYGDQVLAIDGRRVTSANALLNAIASRPADWRTRVSYRNAAGVHEAIVRLAPRHLGGELERVVEEQLVPLDKTKRPGKSTKPSPDGIDHAKHYRHQPGYSNYAVNRRATQRVLDACPQRAAPTLGGSWEVKATDAAGADVTLRLDDQRSELVFAKGRFWIETSRPLDQQAGPPGSGGLIVALHAWRRLLTADADSLSRYALHGPTPWGESNALVDRVTTTIGLVNVEYYFARDNARLIGVEAWLRDDADPCRITFSDFGGGPAALGSDAPAKLAITRGGTRYAEWSLVELAFNNKAAPDNNAAGEEVNDE